VPFPENQPIAALSSSSQNVGHSCATGWWLSLPAGAQPLRPPDQILDVEIQKKSRRPCV